MSELPKDPQGDKGRKSFISKWLGWIFPARSPSSGEPLSMAAKTKQVAKDYWLLIFFGVIMSAMLGYLAYDTTHPDVYVPKEKRELSISEMKKTYYEYGFADGSATKKAFTCTWSPVETPALAPPPAAVAPAPVGQVTAAPLSGDVAPAVAANVPVPGVPVKSGPDGKSYQLTCNLPQGFMATPVSVGADGAPQYLFKSETEVLWDDVKGVVSWLAYTAGVMLVMNFVFFLMVGKAKPGEPKLAFKRFFDRITQSRDGTAAGGSGNKDDHGAISITVIKPEDNRFRLSDFIGEEEVMDELVPFIKGAQAQRIKYEEDIAAVKKQMTAEKKNPQDIAKAIAAVPIPSIPEGRYGHIQNTKYIIEGDPGTGKSLFPLVAAGEAGVTIISVAGTFENVFLAAGAKNVRAMVEIARQNAPCIIFMDEGEEGAKQRSKDAGNGSANSDGSTTALLKEIDGVETKVGKSNGIHWVLATNYVDKIDEAMKRSGRLKVLRFSKPSLENLKKLLKLFFGKLPKLPLASNFNPDMVASILLGKTGADIEELANQFAGLAEEIAKQTEAQLKARAKVERKRLTKDGVTSDEIDQQLESAGLSDAQIEKHLATLTFGHAEFIESVLRLLMGRKKKIASESFTIVRDIDWHEGLHGLASAAMTWLNLYNWKVRFFTIGKRQRSLGLMYSSPDDDESLTSIANVLARAVVAYAGGMGQLVGHDDYKRWGEEIDLYRDSGTTADNEQAAQLIHHSIIKFGGSLRIGPVSKGQAGYSWFTEMGPGLVDDIDKEVRIRQKLGQFLAWKLSSIFMQNEVVWDLFAEVLTNSDRIILQDRFYELFDKIMSDRSTRSQILALPALYNKLASNENQVLAWRPSRQSFFARRYIAKKTAWLETKYLEAKRIQTEAEALTDEANLVEVDETSTVDASTAPTTTAPAVVATETPSA